MDAPTRWSHPLRIGRTALALLAVLLLVTSPAAPAAASPVAELQAAREELSGSSERMVAAVAALRAAEADLGPARRAAAETARRVGTARAALEAAQHAHRLAESAVLTAAAGVERAREAARREGDRLDRMAREAYMQGPAPLGWLLSADSPAQLGGRVESLRRAVAAQRAATDAADLDADRLAAGEDLLGERRDAAVRAAGAAGAALDAVRAGEAAAADALARVDAAVAARAAALEAAVDAQEEDARRYADLQAEAEATRRRLTATHPTDPRDRRDPTDPTTATSTSTSTSTSTTTSTTSTTSTAPASTGATTGDTGAVRGVLAAPVRARVTSPYGMRVHPISGAHKLHSGTDLGASCGTPVAAAAGGRVVEAGTVRGYGERVVLSHAPVGPDGVRLSTTYSHLSRIDVRAGDDLAQGQVLGLVGTTGYSTGCHLHFEVLAGSDYVDPGPWLP